MITFGQLHDTAYLIYICITAQSMKVTKCTKSEEIFICLFIYTANRECPPSYTKCEGLYPVRRCIRSTWLCDGDNDCGNNWDENAEQCGKCRCYLDVIFLPLSLTVSFFRSSICSNNIHSRNFFPAYPHFYSTHRSDFTDSLSRLGFVYKTVFCFSLT